MGNSIASKTRSMGHRINDIVYRNAYRQCTFLFRIVRRIRELPCVAEIRVVGDRHYDAALIVLDGAPVGAAAIVRTVLAAFPEMLSAGNLGALGDIEDRMEVGVVVGQFDDVAIRESVPDALDE